MTLHMAPKNFAHHRVPPEYTPRLKLMPKNRARSGVIDGAWWPRSRSLASELPDLAAVLAVRLGPVERVVYDPAGWTATPREIVIGEHTVVLDAYQFESFNMIYIYGRDGASIVLRVIPAATNDVDAHRALMAVVAFP